MLHAHYTDFIEVYITVINTCFLKMKNKKYHCWKGFKIQCKIDTLSTHTHDRLLSWLGTAISNSFKGPKLPS